MMRETVVQIGNPTVKSFELNAALAIVTILASSSPRWGDQAREFPLLRFSRRSHR
jgi:hypothetical protein